MKLPKKKLSQTNQCLKYMDKCTFFFTVTTASNHHHHRERPLPFSHHDGVPREHSFKFKQFGEWLTWFCLLSPELLPKSCLWMRTVVRGGCRGECIDFYFMKCENLCFTQAICWLNLSTGSCLYYWLIVLMTKTKAVAPKWCIINFFFLVCKIFIFVMLSGWAPPIFFCIDC